MTTVRAYSTVLLVVLLSIAGVAACGLVAAAPSGGLVRLALPESDVAVWADSEGLCRFTGTGLQYLSRTGEPSIPSQWVRVLLPPDADPATVEATVAGSHWTAIDGEWDVPPVGPLVPGECEATPAVSAGGETIVNVRDAVIYESDTMFPAEAVVKADVQVYRGWKMAQVFYAPFAYNPVDRQILRLSGSAIEVTFETASLRTSSAGADLSSADAVRDITVNYAAMAGEYDGYAVSADTGRYVIITTGAIQSASTKLAQFKASKEARGFTVDVVTDNVWGGGNGDAAAENLRSWLKANYEALNIKYVLLIGNPNPASGDVPMKMCYPQTHIPAYSECPTDFYYAELTSNWDVDGDGKYGEYMGDFFGSPPRVAEVSVGRIPYYDRISDLDGILSRITEYETQPDGDLTWRRHALLPMKPSDNITPGYQLGEEIKNSILVPNGWTYHRVYDDDYSLAPVPETYPCTVEGVFGAWNDKDTGAVFWWTHGSSTLAVDVMDTGHAATLDDAHPSFAFQCSCSNGTPEASNNLGYSLLKKGCVSTVAASRVSWYEEGQTSFDGTPTNSGMTFEYAQRLIDEEMYAGDALNGLKADISLYHQVLWMNYLDFNLYGDPALGLYTPPLVQTNAATSLTPTSATLNAELKSLGTGDSAIVSFEYGVVSGGPYPNMTDNQTFTSTPRTLSSGLTGLDPGTTYYYRARGVGWGTGYGEEKSLTTLTEPPSVSTVAVTDKGTTWAVLNGYLEDLGTAGDVTVSFEWGLTMSYGNETLPHTGTPVGPFSDNLTGLVAKTTYHFRAKAVGHGTVSGQDGTFTTLTIPPSVTTSDPSNLTTTSARLNGNLVSKGTASSVSVSLQWGTASGDYDNETAAQVRSTGPYYFNMTGCTPGATYYYRAKAVGDGVGYGDEKSFTALTTPPSVTTGDASNIDADGARLNGDLSSLGTAGSVSVSFQWGTTSDNYAHETAAEFRSAEGAFYFDLSGLSSGATFYYRTKAVGHSIVYGGEKSFITGTPPEVTTLDPSGQGFTGATLNGDLTSLGGADNVTVSFVWGVAPGCDNETAAEVKRVAEAFHFDLEGLEPGTTYYYKAKALGIAGPVYGELKSFATLSTPPAVTTNSASSVAVYSAILNGRLDGTGTADNVTVSFEWGTQSGVYGSETEGVLLTGAGTFTSNLGGLAPGTTFYCRAKAVGHGQAQYGSEVAFSTLAYPTVSTSDAGNVTTTTARLSGDLSSRGSAASVSVCFQWSTSSGLYSNETTAEVRATTGIFYFDLIGLTPGTTYYYRAKAEGDGGAVYGDQRRFTAFVTPPEVTTGDATEVTTHSALLSANLGSLGTKSTVRVSFLWKMSGGGYAETADQAIGATGVVVAGLDGLARGTTYCYKAKAVGDGAPVYGDEKSFTTADGLKPLITMATASSITASRATITWITDEPATSQVEYGPTEEYGSLSTLDIDLLTSHSVKLTHLEAGEVYHFRVVSRDAANNQAVSPDGTFSTALGSSGTPLWPWILVGIGAFAGIAGLMLVVRARRA